MKDINMNWTSSIVGIAAFLAIMAVAETCDDVELCVSMISEESLIPNVLASSALIRS